jgi:uncharacterized protein YjbI with pentapeptide repeats
MDIPPDLKSAIEKSGIAFDSLPEVAKGWLLSMRGKIRSNGPDTSEQPEQVDAPGLPSPSILVDHAGTTITLRTIRPRNIELGRREDSIAEYRFNWSLYERLCHFAQDGQCSDWLPEAFDSGNASVSIELCGADLGKQALGHSSSFYKAVLRNAHLARADFTDSDLSDVDLAGADLSYATLVGARFIDADFASADFYMAITNGALFEYCDLTGAKTNGMRSDENTLFTGSNLESARIVPEVRSALEYNIRRRRWERWQQGFRPEINERLIRDGVATPQDLSMTQRVFRFLVLLFWRLSDFGTSTRRVLETFLALSLAFALLYWSFPQLLDDPSQALIGHNGTSLVRAFYFSIVTMTTLGFGDVCASTTPWWGWCGQVVLVVHVLLGYVALGLLVTRFGVAFTSLGPMAELRTGGNRGL